MKKLVFYSITLLSAIACNSKSEEKSNSISEHKETISDTVQTKEAEPIAEFHDNSLDFIPKGYIIYKEEGRDEIKGDLNKDGLEDLVLMIKGTDKSKVIQHETRGELDRNRRGIIVLFNKGTNYELAVKNNSCFSSENEEGGVYYAPELDVSIEKGNLIVHYAHGRYGYWSYTFRHQDQDFELIGYDASYNRGPVTQYETSINFLTKKKLTRDNLNKDDDGDNYVENFKDTWEKLPAKKLIKLSEIKDFDELNF
ncbi:hypothetical protein [Epilithonimonas sp.]|uniref:hypothetical protein n=1 Tax=Epilithonimonas sp. TaxID=2894511 RepID=UPI002898DAE3|nr:hypothetical protein [Epilithonimonas sp.]